MLSVVWRAHAQSNLTEVIRYIAERNPAAARRMKALIEQSILPAAEHPYLFRPGRLAGTREVVAHPNYVVVYRVTKMHIEVVNVLHTRQQYP